MLPPPRQTSPLLQPVVGLLLLLLLLLLPRQHESQSSRMSAAARQLEAMLRSHHGVLFLPVMPGLFPGREVRARPPPGTDPVVLVLL